MQNFYELSSAAQTAAYQLSELSNYVSEAAKMADSVRMVSNQMKSIYQTAEWNNMAYRLAKDPRLCVPEYQLSNLAKNLAGQARADLNFTNQISALYGSAMESPAFRLSTEMLNSNVLNLTTALRTSNITNLYSNAAAFADQLDSIWSESTYSEKESETVPLASTQAVLDEVEPLLPTEAVETINAKIAEVKTPDNAIPQKDWVGIISIIVTILLFLAGQALSSEHDKKEESSWSATAEYQQEMLEIQREEAERSENFRQRTEEHFKIVEDTNERIAEALEMLANQSVELDDRGQSVLDSDDSQDDAEDQDSIQAAQQEQADAED